MYNLTHRMNTQECCKGSKKKVGGVHQNADCGDKKRARPHGCSPVALDQQPPSCKKKKKKNNTIKQERGSGAQHGAILGVSDSHRK